MYEYLTSSDLMLKIKLEMKTYEEILKEVNSVRETIKKLSCKSSTIEDVTFSHHNENDWQEDLLRVSSIFSKMSPRIENLQEILKEKVISSLVDYLEEREKELKTIEKRYRPLKK